MSKLKIHELAKELNVTSRRLMEKLEEIGIHPKSHMSTLNNDELERLYKHIGIVDRTQKKDEQDSKKDAGKSSRPEKVAKRDIPRIIRKTEVVVRDDYILDEQKEKKKERRSYVRSSDSNDGLMAGFTRSNDSVIAAIRKRPKKEEPKPEPEDKKQEPIDILDSIVVTDRIKKPVDDILSIKKVARVSDLAEKPEDKQSAAKEKRAARRRKLKPKPKRRRPRRPGKQQRLKTKKNRNRNPKSRPKKQRVRRKNLPRKKPPGSLPAPQPHGARAGRAQQPRLPTARTRANPGSLPEQRTPPLRSAMTH